MSEDISIYALAANENFRRIYDGVFAPSGGMHLIRHSMSVKEFDEDLEVRRAEAQAVANMIESRLLAAVLDVASNGSTAR
jgi:hypothetical protein